jgi:NDP-sugar pyrophosphorylase family protein
MRLPPALVLAAGLGTRLRPLTDVRAKAAVPVNGEPLARRVARWLAAQGVTDLVLNLHHQPHTIAREVGDGGDIGARVRYSWESPVLGSAGGPRHALPLLGRTFFLVNGDTLTDVSLRDLLSAHTDSRARVSMALIPNPRPEKYGGVVVSDDGWVTGFSRAGSVPESFHFIGVQVADADVFSGLPDGVPAESVNALYPRLIAANPKSVRGVVCGASFRDIGTPSDYLSTSLELAGLEGDRLAAGARLVSAASASLVRTAVWDDVTIGRDASLVDCIVCDGVQIPDGARYERCAIVRAQDGSGVRAQAI